VRGLLTEEELLAAASEPRYLAGVHVLVSTPEHAVAALQMQPSPLNLTDVKVVVVDEVDAILKRAPASCMTVIEAALTRQGPEAGVAAAEAGAGEGGSVAGGSAAAIEQLRALMSQAQGQEQQQDQDQQQDSDQQQAGTTSGSESDNEDRRQVRALLEQQWQRWSAQQEQQQQQGAPGSGSPDDQQQQQQQQQQEGVMQDNMLDLSALAAAAASSSSGGVAEPTDYDSKPQVVVVGATVTDVEIGLAQQAGWLEEPVLVQVREGGEGRGGGGR
jgi:hypothetical protein